MFWERRKGEEKEKKRREREGEEEEEKELGKIFLKSSRFILKNQDKSGSGNFDRTYVAVATGGDTESEKEGKIGMRGGEEGGKEKRCLVAEI